MITTIHDRIEVRRKLDPAEKKRLIRKLAADLAPGFAPGHVRGVVDTALAGHFRGDLNKGQRRALLSAVTTDPGAWIVERLRVAIAKKLAEYGNGVSITFQRTLRIPDDGGLYPLPPGFGEFPVRRLPALAEQVPADWRTNGDFAIPLRQAEALWIYFDSFFSPPAAVKVGTGLVNAINGQAWEEGLPTTPQGYLVVPEQPWLDGYCVEPGVIRQFVAARLGDGCTAEEQLEGTSHGGLQFEVYPMKPEFFLEKVVRPEMPETLESLVHEAILDAIGGEICRAREMAPGMGMAPGGAMEQEIYEDPWGADAWDLERPQRFWLHICDAARWQELTGKPPPGKPVSAVDYAEQGLPWFDYYNADLGALPGTKRLRSLKTTAQQPALRDAPGDAMDASVNVDHVFHLGPPGKSPSPNEGR